MKVLVTGGSGFIGSHVVDRLRAHGHEPRIFDLVPSPHHRDGDIETVIGDLLDLDAVQRSMRGCDAVVHLAAVADVDRVVAEPSHSELVNGRGTEVLLEAARAADLERVVYASTVWVYGSQNGSGVLAEDALLPLPSHLYTATKLAGEMYCRAYGELYGVEHTILRFGIPYGPRSRPTAVVAAFVARALAGEPLTINGDGMQSRQFVYVEDLAEGVVAALVPAAAGRIYNLVGEQVERWPRVAAEIAAAGHEIALHGYRHRNLLRRTPREVARDLDRALTIIADATGREPRCYRPPYGVFSTGGLLLARRRGWLPLLWSHWGRDWERRATPESIVRRATKGLAAGDVVLLHDADHYSSSSSWRKTAAALPSILDAVTALGLPFVTVTDAM